ncbi:MAG: AAA family ATPase [Bacteroidota bacterium]
MQLSLKKIVILGPESTGKSTLCSQLASHYNTNWCPEYAREYLLQHGTDYSFDDLLTIAKGQLALEEAYVSSTVDRRPSTVDLQPSTVDQPFSGKESQLSVSDHEQSATFGRRSAVDGRLLFIDTDMYVMKVWCEFVFGQCHSFILDQVVERKYDLYLLCKPDLPWVKDELREYPDLVNREKLFHMYKDLLMNQPTPWVEISGGYDQRLAKAISAVDAIL